MFPPASAYSPLIVRLRASERSAARLKEIESSAGLKVIGSDGGSGLYWRSWRRDLRESIGGAR